MLLTECQIEDRDEVEDGSLETRDMEVLLESSSLRRMT